ncbi:hypothetical protein, partial [Mobiluncus mulieris]
TLTVQPKSQVQTTFIPSSLETPTKNQEKINTFCPLSLNLLFKWQWRLQLHGFPPDMNVSPGTHR